MKVCIMCKKEKSELDFYRKRGRLGSWCKSCCNEYNKKYIVVYRDKNKEKVAEWGRIWRLQNRKKQRLYGRLYYSQNKEKYAFNRKKYFTQKPWAKHLKRLRSRCRPKGPYGIRSIVSKLTLAEIERLWFRDKAYQMKQPSIDRIETKGDYICENCRFIEIERNLKRKRG